MGRKITKSFYEWCIETYNDYLLELWDYDLNSISPKEVGFRSSIKIYFKCPRKIHRSELYTINNITGDKHQSVNCRRCQSFGQWCIDTDNIELLTRWDCEKNNISPFEIAKLTGKKYYFKCPLNNPLHKSELKIISNVVQQEGSRRCVGCLSFAQWGIDNICKDFLEQYWSTKNKDDPFSILATGVKKIWIKCQNKNYHDDYLIMPYNFVSGERCPYCSGKKVHKLDSLGEKYKQALYAWSDKNTFSPYEILPYSNKYAWFNCDKHGDYRQKICNFVYNECNCYKCMNEEAASKLQYKVNNYINYLGFLCLHEYDCNIIPVNPKTNHKLPYDNEIPELKLIIEINGEQHYHITNFVKLTATKYNITPEQALDYQQWKDEYKKQYALDNGYEFLPIPYWMDDNNNMTYKKIISEKIKSILKYQP